MFHLMPFFFTFRYFGAILFHVPLIQSHVEAPNLQYSEHIIYMYLKQTFENNHPRNKLYKQIMVTAPFNITKLLLYGEILESPA